MTLTPWPARAHRKGKRRSPACEPSHVKVPGIQGKRPTAPPTRAELVLLAKGLK